MLFNTKARQRFHKVLGVEGRSTSRNVECRVIEGGFGKKRERRTKRVAIGTFGRLSLSLSLPFSRPTRTLPYRPGASQNAREMVVGCGSGFCGW